MTKKLKCPEGGTTYKLPGAEPIYGDPEFQSLLDPLSPAELGTLEANLIADKRATDPIMVWKETRIVMDGYNRLSICAPRDIPFKVHFMSFPDTPDGRTKALEWTIDHQLGRRNLSAEAKAKKVQWRRDRVATAHQAGESNRTIAEYEGVSEKTIRRDIDITGAAVDSPETIKARDGKQHTRSREERLGIKPNVSFVPKGERMDGDDTEQIKQDKLEAKSDPKNGRECFNWSHFNAAFANFMLWVDKMGKSCPGKHHKGPAATVLRSDLSAWKNRFKEWAKAISKKEPVPDVVDKVIGRGRPKKVS